MDSWLNGSLREPYSSLDTAEYSVSFTKVLFPLPDTPVITINFPSGKSTFTFFKLLRFARFMDKHYWV